MRNPIFKLLSWILIASQLAIFCSPLPVSAASEADFLSSLSAPSEPAPSASTPAPSSENSASSPAPTPSDNNSNPASLNNPVPSSNEPANLNGEPQDSANTNNFNEEENSEPQAPNATSNPYYPPQPNFNFNSLENLQPQLFTGSANYAIPIELPASRGNIAPGVSLSYSSQASFGSLGTGWSLNLGSIERSTKYGSPKYDSTDTFVSMFGSVQELASTGNNQYQAKIEESFLKYEYIPSSNSWLVIDKSGIRYSFGQTSASRIEITDDSKTKTFSWQLDRITDLNGNYAQITYLKDNNQVYPLSLSYSGNDITSELPTYQANFSWEDRVDIRTDYRSGLPITTAKRLKEIVVNFNNTERIRKYVLNYDESLKNNGFSSILKSVKLFGASDDIFLPDINLNYQSLDPNFSPPTASWANGYISSDTTPDSKKKIRYTDNDNATWTDTFDLNGDGLPDHVMATGGEYWQVQLNDGSKFKDPAQWGPVARFTSSNTYNEWVIRQEDNNYRTILDTFDLNGDGLPDRVRSWGANNYWSVQLNTGTGFAPITSWQGLEPGSSTDHNYGSIRATPSSNNNSFTVSDTFDINGDSLPDKVAGSGVCFEVQLNTGTGFAPKTSWCGLGNENDFDPIRLVMSNKNTVIDTVDINGDSLPDRVKSQVTSDEYPYWKVQFNTGTGYADPIPWGPIIKFTSSNTFNEYAIRASNPETSNQTVLDFFDLNGDSLPDRVRSAGNSAWYVQLNTGSGFTDQVYWQGLIEANQDHLYNNAIRLSMSGNGQSTVIDTFDLNGDSLPDRILESWGVQLNSNTIKPNLLIGATNGLGGKTDIAYQPYVGQDNSSSSPDKLLPFTVWTVNSITQDSGWHPPITTRYAYDNAFFDFKTKELRGFGYGKTLDPDNNVKETYFKQDDILKGKVEKEITKDSNNNLYAKVENTYSTKAIAPNVNFPYLSQVDNYTYDGDASYKQTQTKYEYDSYGNNTAIRSMGDVNVTGDEKIVFNGYVYNPSLWLMACQRHVFLYGNGIRSSQTWFYHDSNGSVDGTPTKCQTTQKKDWLFNPLTSQTTTPITKYYYDAYGNQVKTIDPLNNATTTEYDTTIHAYPVKTTNALGQTNTFTYDYRFGQVLTSTDANLQTTRNTYDSLGRLIKVVGPLDNDLQPKALYEYDLFSQPIKLTSKVKANYVDTVEKYLTSYTFLDGLGRTLETKLPGEDNPNTGEKRQVVSGAVKYDSRGFIKEKYQPYYVNTTSSYSAPDYTLPYFTMSYDPIGRVVNTTNPDGTYSTASYQDWATTATDENGHSQTNYQDAYGRLTKVEEHNQGQTYTTTYNYNAQDSLTKITDNQGNITEFWYDTLNRKIKMDDPDLGIWTYEYDLNGNLTKQVDAKNQALYFTYDQLNRITKKRYDTTALAVYVYDDVSKPYGIGRLFKETYYAEGYNDGGATKHYYDALGREITTVNNPYESGYYTTSRAYDALDRITSLTYPDRKTIIKYVQGPQGIDAVKQGTTYLISRVDYTPTNQITKVNYGTGITTLYSYNPQTLRLKSILTKNNTTSAILQNLTYSFDNVGNISNIQDNLNTNTQSFEYDDLDRLTKATGSYGTQTYQYDSIGNMTKKDNLTITYGKDNGKLPHAPTSYINQSNNQTTTLDYDGNGSLIKKTSLDSQNNQSIREYAYNSLNRLVQAKNNNAIIANFAYDSNGERFKKQEITLDENNQTKTDTTFYLSNLYELNSDGINSIIRKHVFNNTTRFLTVEEKAGTTPTTTYAYYHSDHLGSSNVVTDQTGTQVSLTEYYPYGGTKRSEGTYDPKYKFNAKELDNSLGLYYYGARYYDAEIGRFTQGDAFQLDYTNYQSLREKTNPNNPFLANQGKEKEREEKQKRLKEFLNKPQNLNIYSYGLNNPLRYTDPSGQSVWDMINGRQTWSEYRNEIGEGADRLYQNNRAAKLIMDHPYLAGGAVGLGTGLGAYGIIQGITWLGLIGPSATQLEQQAEKVLKEGQRGWNPGKLADGAKNLMQHFSKHGNEVNARSVQDYYNKANNFIDSKLYNYSWKEWADTVFYNSETKTINIINKANEIKSFYKVIDIGKLNHINNIINKLDKII